MNLKVIFNRRLGCLWAAGVRVKQATGESLKTALVPAKRLPENMSNRAKWNVRQKHEWLGSPLKGKHLKLRKRVRIGLEAALQRKVKPEKADPAA
jgi:hypothetical protein